MKRARYSLIWCTFELRRQADPKPSIHELGLVGHIEDIVVNKDQQGKKLGFRIIEALDYIAEKVGCYKVRVDMSLTSRPGPAFSSRFPLPSTRLNWHSPPLPQHLSSPISRHPPPRPPHPPPSSLKHPTPPRLPPPPHPAPPHTPMEWPQRNRPSTTPSPTPTRNIPRPPLRLPSSSIPLNGLSASTSNMFLLSPFTHPLLPSIL